MKILLLKFRNIGDVLLSTPLVRSLKAHYPDAQIDFSVNKGTEQMLTLNPSLNNVITYDRSLIKSKPLFKRLFHEIKFIRSFKKENYDIVINLTDGDRGSWIIWFLKPSISIGLKSKNMLFRKLLTYELHNQELRHTVDFNLDPLRVLKIPISEKIVEIFWSNKDEKIVNNLIGSTQAFIHIHPVSRWLFKCISDETMAEIIDYCEIILKRKVILTSSDEVKELQKVESILNFTSSQPINLSGKLSLKQVSALNKKAKLFIGVDTSVMHISASNNTPTLAFFGPSGASNWGPWDNSLKISSYSKINGIQKMGIHRVFSESRSCQPCGKDGCNGTKVSDCLMSLDFDLIKTKIQEMLFEKSN